jgi:hypothetical protein
MKKTFNVNDKVEIFPQEGGWHYIRVPKEITTKLIHKADRGLIAIRATVGMTAWDTSLLPMGDGTHFIALNAKVRRKEKINLGDTIEISFQLRS